MIITQNGVYYFPGRTGIPLIIRRMKNFIRYLTMFFGVLQISSHTYAQYQRLSSHPSSAATIFLDFDGQYISGTSWNWDGPIQAEPSGLSNNAVIEIFNRVSEDYRPFNINITTDSALYFAAPFDKRIRIIITPTYEWYGRAGGISYVGSFNWGNETPAWVFSGLLSSDVKYIAEACSHEAGHTLGLQHQSVYDDNCNKIAEYNDGQGEGEIGWAPIMGLGYYKNLTTWSTGPNTESCDSIQNDLSIIANSVNDIGFREDDHGDDPQSATTVEMGGFSFSVNGLINTSADIDAFKIIINPATYLRLNAIPQNVGPGNAGADIDIKITLMDQWFNIIGIYNPALLLGVCIDTSLRAGDYYVLVTGTGNINHNDYGSLGYYTIVANLAVALPLQELILNAKANKGNHVLNWIYTLDESVKNIVVEASVDGKAFHELVTLTPDTRTFSYMPFGGNCYYRLKVITEKDGRVYYSGISKINRYNDSKPVQLLSNIVQQHMILNASSEHVYQLLDASGRLLLKGNTVKGFNNIDLHNIPSGILFLQLMGTMGGWTERLIKQ